LAKPHWCRQYSTRAQALKRDIDSAWDLLREIEQRVAQARFGPSEIYFDPRNDRGHDWTAIDYPEYPKKRNLPARMLEPSMSTPGPHTRGELPHVLY
jgi:hypothetical protein